MKEKLKCGSEYYAPQLIHPMRNRTQGLDSGQPPLHSDCSGVAPSDCFCPHVKSSVAMMPPVC